MQLKEVLEKNSLSQSWLATEIKLSRATVNLIVKYGKYPTKPDAAVINQTITAAFQAKNIELPDSVFLKPLSIEEMKTMLLQKQSLTQATLKYFGLNHSPFDDDLNSVDDVFISSSARLVKNALSNSAKIGGFAAIIGESGSGKSTLRLELIESLRGQKVVIIEPSILRMEDNDIKGKTLKTGDIEDAIIYALNPNATPKRSVEAKANQVKLLLKSSLEAGYTHLLLIEEAHCLPKPTMKHLKRLHELRDGFKRLLGIVMIGQPELYQKLSNQSGDVREVTQRCEIIELEPLKTDLKAYLNLKFERVDSSFAAACEESVITALQTNLTASGKDYTYPLAVNNLMAAAMTKVAKLGIHKQVKAETINSFFSNKPAGKK